MKRLLPLALLVTVLGPAAARAQEAAEREPHFDAAAVTAPDAAALTGAMIGAVRYQAPQPPQPEVSRNTLELWRGYEPDWRAEIEEVSFTLKFSAPHPAGAEADAAPGMISHVQVQFEDEKIIVRTDTPRFRQYIGGLRFSPSFTKDWRQLLAGQGLSSLALLLPRQSAEHPEAVLICPIGMLESAPGQERPAGVGFQVSDLRFSVGAHLRGNVQSGVGVGRAFAVVQTTPDILPGLSFLDEAVSHDPSVSVEYTPDKRVQPEAAATDRGGVRVRLELQNSAGYQRISELSEMAFVQELSYPEPIAVRSTRGESTFPAGRCIAVQKVRTETHVYSRGAAPVLPSPDLAPTGAAKSG